MYKDVPYQKRPLEEVKELIRQQAELTPHAERIFLADGDPLRRPASELFVILHWMGQHFPRVARIHAYATGTSILDKSEEELHEMRLLKLHTLYMGLESGDDETLRRSTKQETVRQMMDAGIRAQSAGLRMSVMILLGLAGRERSAEHVEQTAQAVNAMQPRLLSCLRAVPIPGTAFDAKIRRRELTPLTEHEIVQETGSLVERLDLSGTVFRANHSSNVLPLEGRLSRDRKRLMAQLDEALSSGLLDRRTPGTQSLWL